MCIFAILALGLVAWEMIRTFDEIASPSGNRSVREIAQGIHLRQILLPLAPPLLMIGISLIVSARRARKRAFRHDEGKG